MSGIACALIVLESEGNRAVDVVDQNVPQVWGELDAGDVEGGELFLVILVGGLAVFQVADLVEELVVLVKQGGVFAGKQGLGKVVCCGAGLG